jgi:hypothetical protein
VLMLYVYATCVRCEPCQCTPKSYISLFPSMCSSEPDPKYTFVDSDTEDLASKISSLSVNESERTSRASLSFVRQVTLPPEEETKIRDANFRLSIDSIAEASNSRPSMDSHAHSTDLNLHLYGNSPRIGLGRPPKMSMGSMCSTDNTRSARSSTPSVDQTCAPCPAFNFVTTYVHCVLQFTDLGLPPSHLNFFVCRPLVNQDRGWGSRPIDGRDWGTSLVYDETLMGQLMFQFVTSCGVDGMFWCISDVLYLFAFVTPTHVLNTFRRFARLSRR